MAARICKQCGGDMKLAKHFKGSLRKKAIRRFQCINSFCLFEEAVTSDSEETDEDRFTASNDKILKKQAKELPE